MIYYPIYEEQVDEDDNIFNYIAGIICFTEGYLCNTWDNTGKQFHTSVGEVEDYVGSIRDLDTDYECVEEYKCSSLEEARKRLMKFVWHDFR